MSRKTITWPLRGFRGARMTLIGYTMLAGCALDGSGDQHKPGKGLLAASLERVQDCDDVLFRIKARLIEQMETRIDERLASALQQLSWHQDRIARDGDDACGDLWGRDINVEGDVSYASAAPAPTDSAGPSAGGVGAGESAESYSETNTQVAGVDEADFIKNDGSYIYLLADGRLQIVDAWPADAAQVIASAPIEGDAKKLYIHADRAFVYSSLSPVEGSDTGMPYRYYGASECTYGYDCQFTGDGRPTKITIFDISNRRHPKLVREMRFNGSYLNSRRIAEHVYSVITFPEVRLTNMRYWPDAFDWCELAKMDPVLARQSVTHAYRRLAKENRAIIAALALDDVLPRGEDTHYAGKRAKTRSIFHGCSDVYASSASDGQSFLTVVGSDMVEPASVQTTTIVGPSRPGVCIGTGPLRRQQP